MNSYVEASCQKLDKVIANFENALRDIRTGAANPNMLSKVEVLYYGAPTPINQIASISVVEGRQLYVKPYDSSIVKDVEKAIFKANLGLTPQSDGTGVRINVPMLTEDRRKEYAKLAAKYAEEAKTGLRNVRREVIDQIKKDKSVPEDLRKAGEEDMNKVMDKYTKKIEKMLDDKKKDIMKV